MKHCLDRADTLRLPRLVSKTFRSQLFYRHKDDDGDLRCVCISVHISPGPAWADVLLDRPGTGTTAGENQSE